MVYIDTDVLIHFLFNQTPQLHARVTALLSQLIVNNNLAISWLSVQEAAFVLAKLGQQPPLIVSDVNLLITLHPYQYGMAEFTRATDLAKIIGFKSFNDCLHVAIAENHCTDLYTCNVKDFKRLEPYTVLKIHIVH